MRIRIGGLLALATVVTWAASACNTAGVSFVYMSIDNGGAQPRTTFFTDSTAIYCIAKFSAARQDATLDYVIHQKDIFPWCTALTNPLGADSSASDIHPIFGVAELTPGTGVETVAAAELVPNGVSVQIPCNGQCYPNRPSGNICKGAVFNQAANCPTGLESQGPDSCGIGLTCCAYAIGSTSSAMAMPLATVPYPAGVYSCVVSLDGVEAGEAEFTIEYPPAQGGHVCPIAPPVSTVPCYGWVPANATCPGFEPQSLCTCDPSSGNWSCTL